MEPETRPREERRLSPWREIVEALYEALDSARADEATAPPATPEDEHLPKTSPPAR